MKRFELLITAYSVAVLCHAQIWQEPKVPGENLNAIDASTTVYVMNVDADAFVLNGMTSNSQACATRLTNGDDKVTVPQRCNAIVTNGKVKIYQEEYNRAFVSCPTESVNDVLIANGKDVNSEFHFEETSAESRVYTLTNAAFGKKLDVSWEYGGHLTLTGGVDKTKWAFIKESNVTNGKYSLYKSKKRMYDVYKALVDAGKTAEHKSAINNAYEVYTSDDVTIESVTEATRKLFEAVFVDIKSPVNVSFMLDNADLQGSMKLDKWSTASPGAAWGELEMYRFAFTLEQDKVIPLGKYDVGIHALYREEGSGSAPKLTVKTGRGSYSGATPQMKSFDYGVTNASNNNWMETGGLILPSGMQACAQALTHSDAMAWVRNVYVASDGNIKIKYNVPSNEQWVNFGSVELIYRGVERDDLLASLKSEIDAAMTLYGDGGGIDADALKAAADAANLVYADTSVTNKGVKDAIDAVRLAMKNYLYTNASVENPMDKTDMIVNPNFEKGFEGWSMKDMWSQGNKTFKQYNGEIFIEKWTGRGENVGNASVLQTIAGLDMGVYQLVAGAQNIQENMPTVGREGAWLVANTSKEMVGKPAQYTLTFTNIESEVTVGFDAEDATGNWIAVDNFRLYYIGNDADYKAELKRYLDNAQALMDSKMHAKAYEALKGAYEAAKAEYDKTTTDGYIAVSTPLRKTTEEAQRSADAYAALLSAIIAAEEQYATNSSENLFSAINIAKGLYEDSATRYEDMESVAQFLNVAANSPNTVYQVVSAVALTDAVDFHVAGVTPFATAGVVDIIDSDAVLIIDRVKPSIVLANLMPYIRINGEEAKDGENCQVRMYGTGAIIFPYGKDFKPLTVYSEQNFKGTAVNDFGLENSNGYMNTLTDEKLNNAIRSFKLKRGYMVTFSIGREGRGYSRCFIADHEVLEFATLPAVLDKHISSYRVFKWNNAQKKGLASDTSVEGNQVLNSAWCYDWGGGWDCGPDTECVPHKIHKWWPGPSELGRATYSPHMKTDNEPGNGADDTPASVEDVLAYWEDVMATGMRLCSPSSHDGSLDWLRTFMNEIDARGWRCDILDMHCYWDTGSFPWLQSWYNDYKRPIWISEFVWGASWNGNGIFASSDRSFSMDAQQRNYNGMRPILESLNSMPYVERYAYWNSEADCSKLYKYGTGLSLLGEFYAEMNSGLGYNENYQYVPRVVHKGPSDLVAELAQTKKLVTLEWNHPNGELTDSIVVERMVESESSTFIPVKTIYDTESVEMTFEDVLRGKSGNVRYRIKNYDLDGKVRTTGEVSVFVTGANGNDFIKYGTLQVIDLEAVGIDFNYPYDEAPALFVGLCSNNNADVIPTHLVSDIGNGGFTYQMFPLQHQKTAATFVATETVPFMALPYGNHTFGQMDIEVASAQVAGDTVEVKFSEPFPEQITPVVLAQLVADNRSASPYFLRVWDVTNEGFKAVVFHEEAFATVVTEPLPFCYAAFTPGSECIDDHSGLVLSAGLSASKLYGTIPRLTYFADDKTGEADTLLLEDPIVFASLQTFNYTGGTSLRQTTLSKRMVNGTTYADGVRIRKCVDGTKTDVKNNSSTADYAGWVAVSKSRWSAGEVGIDDVAINESPIEVEVVDRCIRVRGCKSFEVCTMSGARVDSSVVLQPGIYLVRSGRQTAKVLVK